MDNAEMFYIDMLSEGYKSKQILKKKFINKHYPEWKISHDFIVKSHNEHCENKLRNKFEVMNKYEIVSSYREYDESVDPNSNSIIIKIPRPDSKYIIRLISTNEHFIINSSELNKYNIINK